MSDLKPPCDCIEEINGFLIATCYCGNSGDARDAHTYCAYQNMERDVKMEHMTKGLGTKSIEGVES